MRIEAHYITESEREPIADALYHEGLGYLNRPEFALNVPHIIGSPDESPRVYEIIEAVISGTYRGYLVPCGRPNCYCR